MGRPLATATNSGHQDSNQNFSIIGVQGTLGTADLQGTSMTLPYGIDPTTGAMYTIGINLPITSQNNPEIHLYYLSSGLLGTVTETFGTATYTKILEYDNNNILGTVTAWV